MSGLNAFTKVDASKLDPSEFEDITDKGVTTGHDGATGHQDIDEDGMGAEEQWQVCHMDEKDVGTTVDIFPTIHGEGVVKKKLLQAGVEFDNPREGWAAELTYEARLVGGDGVPFDKVDKEIVALVQGRFPRGVEAGLKTMRETERAIITVQAQAAFGAHGEPTLGVPSDSAVEYTVTCHRVIEVVRLDQGRIIKRRMYRGEGWEKPEVHYEVEASWRGWVKGDESRVFRDEAPFAWTGGDESVPPVFNRAVLGRMIKNDVCEIEVAPKDESGVPEGFEAYGIPAGSTIVLSVTLTSFVCVEDVSKEQDGRLKKRVLTKGDGWEKPRKHYRTTINLQVRREPGDTDPLVQSDSLEVVLGSVDENATVRELGTSCGGADLDAVLAHVLPSMSLGEECELCCRPESLAGMSLSVRIKMASWVVVEAVPLTENEIMRTVIMPADADKHERPVPLSRVEVNYTVRRKGSGEVLDSSGDAPCTFVVSDLAESGMLPCVDMGVREMKLGEKSLFDAPSAWAYTCPEYAPLLEAGVAPSVIEKTVDGVEFEIELLSFARGKDFFQLSGDEKLAEMAKYRNAGNKNFKAGPAFVTKAVKRYEESLRKKAHENDFKALPADEREAKLAEVKKHELSLHLNLAAANLKRGGKAKDALHHANKAFDLDATSMKAFFRRGQAKAQLGDIEGAKSDLLQAAKRDPQNRDVRKELEQLKAQNAVLKQQQKNLYGGMFS